jgi:hypothetical protein
LGRTTGNCHGGRHGSARKLAVVGFNRHGWDLELALLSIAAFSSSRWLDFGGLCFSLVSSPASLCESGSLLSGATLMPRLLLLLRPHVVRSTPRRRSQPPTAADDTPSPSPLHEVVGAVRCRRG